MQKLLKSTILIVIMLFTFSLIGCGMNTSAPQESKKAETAPTETTKQTDKVTEKAKPSKTEEKKITEVTVKKQEDTSKKDINQVPSKKTVEVNKNSSTNDKEQTKKSEQNSKSNTSTAVVKKTTTSSPTKKTNTSTTKTVEKTTKPSSPKPVVQKPISTVTMSIVGPKDRGTIVAASKISIKEGDTVLKVLLSGAQKNGVAVDYKGSGATAYIEGIDNYYEFDYGPKSGWTCKKNGVTIPKSAGVITVKAGDRIDWIYTEDYAEKK